MSITVLWSGIDTLEASYKGVMPPCLLYCLERGKAFAQQYNEPEPMTIGGYPMSLQAQGFKPWKYVLCGEDFQIRLSPGRSPNASIRLLSLGLLRYGHEELFALAEATLNAAGAFSGLGLSRLDFSCDFQGFEPTFEDSRRIVCPASFRPIYPNVEHPETFQFGKGDQVVRIYNKSREIETSGKEYWREVWAAHPDFDPDRDVWRFEFQLRREALAMLNCRDPHRAFERLPDILATGLKWAELRVPNGLSTDRWDTDPVWAELAQATGAHSPLSRIKAASYVGGLSKLVPMTAGLLVSVAARLGISELHLALEVLCSLIEEYFERRGISFEREVRKRQIKIDGSRKELQSGRASG